MGLGSRVGHHLRVGEGHAQVVLDHAVHHALRVGVLEGVQQLQLPARVRVSARVRARARARTRARARVRGSGSG